MKIVDTGEHWKWNDETDDGQFSHTIIIATDAAGQVYFSKVQDRLKSVEEIDAEDYQWLSIPADHIYPLLPSNFRVWSEKIDDSAVFHKKPRFVTYDGSSDLADALLRETMIYETLQRHEYPFIARYRGCIVSDGRIVGLALTKYDGTLDVRMKQRPVGFVQATRWLTQIQHGLDLIHRLGLAHNDLSPWNIMISTTGSSSNEDEEEEPENAVVIDFDSCCPLGDELIKGGTPGWSDDDARRSAIANDVYSLRKIAVFLGIPPNQI